MSGTYTKILYHIVFSTKRRQPSITPEIKQRLHEYVGGVVRSLNGVPLRIGGVQDHVHLLIRWRTDETLAALMRTVKSQSSAWIHETFPGNRDFAWQEGYAAFSVSQSQAAVVDRYIATQAEHHRRQSFVDELRDFLRAHEVEFEERYIAE